MMPEVIPDLLRYIHKFYPIGMPELYAHPRPLLERDRVVESKITEIINDVETPWKHLVHEIKKDALEVLDMGYRQFPSYYLSIKQPTYLTLPKDIEYSRSLELIVSLLCPYYTAFFKDEYRFNNIQWEMQKYGPDFRIFFTKLLPPQSVEIEDVMNKLKMHTEKIFPKHVYVSHNLLLSRTVTGGVQLEAASDAGPYPIFSYLFEDNTRLENLEIRP